jgi:hypothetical protein
LHRYSGGKQALVTTQSVSPDWHMAVLPAYALVTKKSNNNNNIYKHKYYKNSDYYFHVECNSKSIKLNLKIICVA